MMHNRITLDIETIPSQKPGAADEAASRVTAPANYRDPEKIAAYIAEKAGEAWRRTSLDGGYGEVCVIGYALGDEEPSALYRDPFDESDSEGGLLLSFWEMLAEELTPAPTWVGHSVARFDLKFLYHRSVVLQVPIPFPIPYDSPAWSDEVNDTSLMWTLDRQGGIRLGTLCEILGVPTPKGDIDGSQVWEAIEAGRLRDVVQYNIADVRATRECWRRMRAVTPWAKG